MLIKKMDAPHDMQIGARFNTRKHGYVSVIEYYNTHTVIVAFENTGNIRSINAAKLRSGELTDRSVPPQSLLIGQHVDSDLHGTLTVSKVESDNIVVLVNDSHQEVRLLLATVQSMLMKSEVSEKKHSEKEISEFPTSLSELTKRNRKTKDVNNLLRKMITDYGSTDARI
ncbi:hypothetical protein [Vibrio hangzhouensis]|uniref:hypothetical protein n=1 Tax=Vibrio hangzhouensis TaxID=462991 RepID=UPI0021BC2936|nr:hypothetical protein [Vibrio hangzhouensis]